MGLVSGIAMYFVLWWLCLFVVLPFGVKTLGETGNTIEGAPDSAPAKFNFWMVLLKTTLVAAVVFAAIYAIVIATGFNFRDFTIPGLPEHTL